MGQGSGSRDIPASLLEGGRQACSLCRGWGENIPFSARWIRGRTRSPLPVLSPRAGGHRLPPIPQSLSSWLCRHSAPAGARPGSPHSTSLVLEKVERSQEQQSPGQEEIPRHSGPAFAAHTLPRLSSGRGGDSDSPGREGLSPPERLSPPPPGGEAVPGGTSMEGTEFPTPHPGRAGLPSLGHSGSWKSSVLSKGGRAAVSLHPELCSHTGREVTAGTFVSWTFGIMLEPCQAHSCASVSCWRSSAEATPHSLGNSIPQCQELGWSLSWAPRNFLGCSDLSGSGNVAVRVERRDLASPWWVW